LKKEGFPIAAIRGKKKKLSLPKEKVARIEGEPKKKKVQKNRRK